MLIDKYVKTNKNNQISKSMEQLLKLIQQLTPRKDRLEHFYWGFIYMVVGFLLTAFLKLFITTSVGFENLFLWVPLWIGLIKEIRDIRKGSGFDVIDWLFTVLPAFITLIIILFLLQTN